MRGISCYFQHAVGQRRTSSTATSASSCERTASRKRSLEWNTASLEPPTRPDGTELRATQAQVRYGHQALSDRDAWDAAISQLRA